MRPLTQLAALAALAAAGCAATVAPRTGLDVPVSDADERGMWRLAEESAAAVEKRGHLYADPELEAYLLDVARRLEPPSVLAAIPFRVRVLRDRTPNAACLPNGAIFVNTGLLQLARDEAELAGVLAHEMTHAVGRHALRSLRTNANAGAWAGVFGALTLGVGTIPGQRVWLGSVVNYGRDLEREADREGQARLAEAGYDPAASWRMLERMRDWTAAEGAQRGDPRRSTHPADEERIADLRARATSLPSRGELGADRYEPAVAPLLLDGARTELAGGRAAQARALAERYIAIRPEDARGYAVSGEIDRREAGDEATARALANYRRAISLDAGAAEAWRGLGLVLVRTGDRAGARDALARYLALEPQAPDRAHVNAMLQELPREEP